MAAIGITELQSPEKRVSMLLENSELENAIGCMLLDNVINYLDSTLYEYPDNINAMNIITLIQCDMSILPSGGY